MTRHFPNELVHLIWSFIPAPGYQECLEWQYRIFMSGIRPAPCLFISHNDPTTFFIMKGLTLKSRERNGDIYFSFIKNPVQYQKGDLLAPLERKQSKSLFSDRLLKIAAGADEGRVNLDSYTFFLKASELRLVQLADQLPVWDPQEWECIHKFEADGFISSKGMKINPIFRQIQENLLRSKLKRIQTLKSCHNK